MGRFRLLVKQHREGIAPAAWATGLFMNWSKFIYYCKLNSATTITEVKTTDTPSLEVDSSLYS